MWNYVFRDDCLSHLLGPAMIRFTKAEMLEEFREVIYQYARGVSFALGGPVGYQALFGGERRELDADVLHFMKPDVRAIDQSFTIDDLYVTRSVEQFYDYGLMGVRNMEPVESGGANDWTFAYGLVWDTSHSILISESLNGEPVTAKKCLCAAKAFFARLVLDGNERTSIYGDEIIPSDMLSIPEVAILAGLDERTVRNATSKNATNRLETDVVDNSIFIPREAALVWLQNKRGFIPTRVGDDLPSLAALNGGFVTPSEAGDFVRKNRERLQLDQTGLLAKAGVTMDPAGLNSIETGQIINDEAALNAIGIALGFNGQLFALRLLEAKQKQNLRDLQHRILTACRSN
jgi:hypothetical protein